MPAQCIKFGRLMVLPIGLFKSIGMEAYDYKRRSTLYKTILQAVFLINIINLNLVGLSEFLFVLNSFINSRNILDAIMNMSYIGYIFVSVIKILSVYFDKPNTTKLMKKLVHLYPKTVQHQRDYKVSEYLSRYNSISIFFMLTHLTLIWTYNLFPIVSYLLYDVWLNVRKVELTLPYFCYVPWEWRGHWSYQLLYASQNLAGHTTMCGQLATDLLLCCIVTQVIMHFEYLARSIENRMAPCDQEESMKFLHYAISYHQQILELSDSMNEIFGVPLLINFLSSSFIMCFLGFQTTLGKNTDNLVMLLLFLGCSLIQIYMISNYAQKLIQASTNVGHAVYKHNWQIADIKYRKMLVLIIQRSQKPAMLKATTFLDVSMGTMTDLLQLSYKFFALLRTIYSK